MCKLVARVGKRDLITIYSVGTNAKLSTDNAYALWIKRSVFDMQLRLNGRLWNQNKETIIMHGMLQYVNYP